MTCDAPEAVPSWVPDWIFCPREKILEVVIAWFIDGLEAVRDETVFAVQVIQDEIIGAFVVAGEAVFDAAADVGNVVLDLQVILNSVIYDLAAGSGFAGPLAATATFVLVVAVVFGSLRLGTWLLKWVT